MKVWIWSSVVAALMSFAIISTASAQGQSPEQIIQLAGKKLLVDVKQETAHFKSHPQRMYNKVQNLLTPITEFSAIARGVMGSYYKTANANQKSRFATVFKQSLVKIYADSIMKVEIKTIKPRPTKITNPKSRKRSVIMVLTTTDGKSYQVSYGMVRNKQNRWMIRNIVVDGVNFGLTYRNQFKSEMNRRGNNMDQVIANWATIVTKK